MRGLDDRMAGYAERVVTPVVSVEDKDVKRLGVRGRDERNACGENGEEQVERFHGAASRCRLSSLTGTLDYHLGHPSEAAGLSVGDDGEFFRCSLFGVWSRKCGRRVFG